MPAKKRWIFVREIMKGDTVKVRGTEGWKVLEADANGGADKKRASVLLVDDDLRVYSYSGDRDAECLLVKPGPKRRELEASAET